MGDFNFKILYPGGITKKRLVPPMARAQRRRGALNYKCTRCGRCFANRQQLGGHLSKGRVCSAVITTAEFFNALPTTVAPPSPDTQSDSSSQQEITAATSGEENIAHEPAAFSAADDEHTDEHADVAYVHLHQLLQRPGVHEAKHRIADTILRPGSRARTCNPRNALKLDAVRFPVCVCNSCSHIIVVSGFYLCMRPPG